MGKFQGQVVIVTGGGAGIGRSVSQTFAAEGAKVVIAELDREAGEENQRIIRVMGGESIFLPTDISKEEDVIAMVKETVNTYGQIDVLINNAGVGWAPNTLYERPMDEWDHVLNVNLRGTYMCSKYVAIEMRKRNSGAIINIASTRALMSEAHSEPYSASKGGILALSHSMAISLGPDGIRVNAISPGWIEVGDWQSVTKQRSVQHSESDRMQHPVGRVGRPEDIAKACLFLASADAGFITGTNLVIDGGMTVKMIYAE